MASPFENEGGVYHVLINKERQYSLWPGFVDVPAGWTIVHEARRRAECLGFINDKWTDIRPRSLLERMNARDPRI